MARARSIEKRQAILSAAVSAIAQTGLGASTAKIAAGAGLAEGTIFTYFPSKADLLNDLYSELKTEVHQRLEAGFPHDAGLRERACHIWTEYLRWAMEKPREQKVAVLLNLSNVISVATKKRMSTEHGAIAMTMNELGKHGAFQGLPHGFTSSAMLAMQEAVMEMTAKKPRQRAMLVEQAFEAFWCMAK